MLSETGMEFITKHLASIIENQKRIGYPFSSLLNEGASRDEIADAEEKLGFPLNTEIIELYSMHNGTTPANLPSGKTGIIPIHNWLSLQDAITNYKVQIEFKDAFHNHENDYSPGANLFPFLSDGAGNFYWVDLNKNSKYNGQIYWTNTFGDDTKYVSNSLTAFFKDISSAYSDNTFFLDKEGYLDCDWDRWKY